MICKKRTELDVNKDNPWIGDLLNRKVVADDFSQLVLDIADPFVIAVNAPYGTGKTFFLKRWACDLKNNPDNFVVFFNAWSTDFEKDPLVPFIDTILKELPRNKIQSFQKKAKELLVSIKDYGNFVAECCGGPENAFEKAKHILNPIKNYEEKLKLIESFKQEISATIQGKKLFIFVDELERCRPTYAIETLEVIKHLFDIPNVIFILGTDRNQLQATIATLYGSDMDRDGYLRRFIDLELTLPKPDLRNFCLALCTEFGVKNQDSTYEKSFINGWGCFCEYFSELAELYKLSLREVLQCFTGIKILHSIIPENNLKLMPILALFFVLKCKQYALLLNFATIPCDELFQEKNLAFLEGKDDPYFTQELIAMIRLLKTPNLTQELEQTKTEVAVLRGTASTESIRKLPTLTRKEAELQKAKELWEHVGQRYHFIEPQDLLDYLLRLVMYIGIK